MFRFAFAMFCAAMVSKAVIAAPCAGFTDVDDSSGSCVNVEWMKNRGITLGVTPTLYDPNSPVTRLQMAAFMYRLGFQNAFLQGGNAFGTSARLGTADPHGLELVVGSLIGARIDPAPFGNVNVALGRDHFLTPGIYNSTVAGGAENRISASYGSVGGGGINQVNGQYATVPGGIFNRANGQFSFAAGRNAFAAYDGCFVWGQSPGQPQCFAPKEVVMEGQGGFYFWTSGSTVDSFAGARLASGTGAWAAYSDRNGKHAVEPVDPHDVLARVVAMPIATWQWTAEAGRVRHMGPMAQDFKAAFELGDSDKQIVTVDADGVALAAIQGLNAKLEAEVVSLRAELSAIRSLLSQR